jgi:hypothetical protein
VTLRWQRNCVIQDINGSEIAVLDKKTSAALLSLHALESVRYEVYSLPENWREAIEDLRTTSKDVVMDLEVNVFGPMVQMDQVGRVLSNAGVYLQHPRFISNSMRYENPHCIRFEGFECPLPEIQVQTLESRSIMNADECFKLDPEHILSNLDTLIYPEDLSTRIDETAFSNQLKRYFQMPLISLMQTSIFNRHQKEAIFFISMREQLDTPRQVSIWKTHRDQENGQW